MLHNAIGTGGVRWGGAACTIKRTTRAEQRKAISGHIERTLAMISHKRSCCPHQSLFLVVQDNPSQRFTVLMRFQ